MAAPPLLAQAVVPLPAATASRPTTQPGDGSAPTPGADFTTVAGRPNVLAKPDYLKNPKPKYPPVAERRNQQGTVVLNVTVSASGRAAKISVKKSSGFELLDQAAITAVREWEFTPARIGSLAVESEIEVPWRFTLTN
jgi:protein TonB